MFVVSPTAVALSSQNSPRGSPYYPRFEGAHLNDAGRIAFGAWDGVGPLVVAVEGGSPTIVVSDGTVAPGTDDELHENWLNEGFQGVSLAEDGRVSYVSTLSSCADEFFHPVFGLVYIPCSCAVFEWDGDASEQVVRDGQSPPQGGASFHTIVDSVVGEAGDVVFRHASGIASDGIYARLDGGLVEVMRGNEVPGIPASTNPYVHTPRIGADREILFLVTFFDPSRDAALFMALPPAIRAPALSRSAAIALALSLMAAAWLLHRPRLAHDR